MKFARFFLPAGIAVVIPGCLLVRAPSEAELRALDNPPAEIAQKIDRLFPRALAWYENTGKRLQAQGRPLTPQETAIAQTVQVQHPERVRLIILEEFPLPLDSELRELAEQHGMGSAHEGARTHGYAILRKPQHADKMTILAHELVHVAQYERMGAEGFVHRYLVELEMMGYTRAPMELEAYDKQSAGK